MTTNITADSIQDLLSFFAKSNYHASASQPDSFVSANSIADNLILVQSEVVLLDQTISCPLASLYALTLLPMLCWWVRYVHHILICFSLCGV